MREICCLNLQDRGVLKFQEVNFQAWDLAVPYLESQSLGCSLVLFLNPLQHVPHGTRAHWNTGVSDL